MVVLRTNQAFRFGQKNIIPYAGEVQISETGEIEVPKELARQIVESNCGFCYADEAESNKIHKVEESDFGGQKEDLSDKKVEDTINKSENVVEDKEDNKDSENNEDEGGSGEEDPNKNEGGDDEDLNEDELRVELQGKTVAEIKELAKDSGLDEEEYKGLKKDELIDYIIAKLKE